MPNILDAFVITLKLDSSGYLKGSKEADDAISRTREHATEGAKVMEYRGKQAAEFFGAIRRSVIELFAAFKLGQGFKSFIEDITKGDANLGRFARTIGLSAQQVSILDNAAIAMGGSAQGMNGTLSNLNKIITDFALTGKTDALPVLNRLHISLKDSNGQLKNSAQLFDEVVKAIQGMPPEEQTNILQRLGFTPDMIAVAEQGYATFHKFMDEVRNYGPSDEQVKLAQQLQSGYFLLDQSITSLARDLWSQFEPAIISALGFSRDWIDTNKQLIEQKFDEYIQRVVNWFKQFWQYTQGDWGALYKDVKDLISTFGDLLTTLGLVKDAGKDSFKPLKDIIDSIDDSIKFLTANMRAIVDLSHGDFKKAWQDLGEGGKDAVDALNKLAPGATGPTGGPEQPPAPVIPGPGPGAMGGMQLPKSWSDFWDKLSNWRKGLGAGAQKSAYYPGGGGGRGRLSAEQANYIRAAAIQRGIDPNIPLQIAMAEGGGNIGAIGDRGSSFGLFQLHYGGVAGGGNAVGGLGDEFTRKYGLDARDPSTWQKQTDFVLDYAAKHGWAAFHAFHGAPFAGIGGMAGGGSLDNSTHKTDTNIHITVNSNATNAKDLVNDIDKHLENSRLINSLNYSQA